MQTTNLLRNYLLGQSRNKTVTGSNKHGLRQFLQGWPKTAKSLNEASKAPQASSQPFPARPNGFSRGSLKSTRNAPTGSPEARKELSRELDDVVASEDTERAQILARIYTCELADVNRMIGNLEKDIGAAGNPKHSQVQQAELDVLNYERDTLKDAVAGLDVFLRDSSKAKQSQRAAIPRPKR